uniref:Transmembrane protein n=1 Tax=Haemonchus contortus TaxID=6289 RepID=A0A7I4Y1E9_HAECO
MNGRPTTSSALTSTCFISPKATGVASLALQFILLVISVLITLFFFYHIGGHECTSWEQKFTTFQPIMEVVPLDSSANYSEPPKPLLQDDITMNNRNIATSDDIIPTINCSKHTEQLPYKTIYLDILGTNLNILELIHLSTIIYAGISATWLFTIILLLVTMRCRILDTVIINAMFLTIAATYALVHAVLIGVLFYNEYILSSWKTMAIVIGCSIALVGSTILCFVALALVIAWYRYIIARNNTEKCFCLYGLMSLIKKIKGEPRRAAQEYALPDVTSHSQLPYDNGRHQTDFSSF